jgi:putative DNA primase/helicase
MGWRIIDETDLLNIVAEISPADTIPSNCKHQILEALKQVGRLCEPQHIKETWVQFKGNIYDVETGDLHKATPEHFSTNPIPWEISEDEETPTIDKLFEEWVGKDYVRTLQEIAAYCMLPSYPIHRIFCFLGSGRNGKSRYLAFIDKLIGRDNTCSVELDNLVTSRFESFNLYKKLVALMGETNFSTLKRSSILKKLSGEDLFSFEAKGKDSLKDYNYAKLLISTNNLPETTDKTDGWYRRWVLIDFPNEFPEGRDILATIPDEEYSNFCKKSLKILKDLFEVGKFTNEGSIDERRNKYEEKSNPFDKFIKENCVLDPEMNIPKRDFFKQFTDYCISHKFNRPVETEVGKKLKAMGLVTRRLEQDWFTKEGNKARVNCWEGIGWKSQTLEKEFVEELIPDKEEIKMEELE